MAPEQTLSDDDFAELDSLLADLIELRATLPPGMTYAGLPTLPEIAHGDQRLLAVLEVRLERVRWRAGSQGEA